MLDFATIDFEIAYNERSSDSKTLSGNECGMSSILPHPS